MRRNRFKIRSKSSRTFQSTSDIPISVTDSVIQNSNQANFILISLPIGIFKIEDSAHVARLWGIRKNRPAMNYDKLSRSIRQYYKKGIIRKPDVSRRLVYQFVNPL